MGYDSEPVNWCLLPSHLQHSRQDSRPALFRQTRSGERTSPPAPAFAEFLAKLTARFSNISIEAVDDEITDSLRRIVEFLGVDRCSLARFAVNGEFLVINCYAAPGVKPLPVGDIRPQWPWYADELLHGRAVRVSCVEDLPPQATSERAYVAASGMKSHLGIPITVAGMPLCALGVATFSRQMEFEQEFITSLLLAGEVLVGALAWREAECRLRRMEAELSHITRVATVGQLATSIAHEINQPLCAIVSNAQAAIRLLEQGQSMLGEVTAALRDITADGKRASEIVSRSHLLLKPKELSFQPVSLNNVVHDVHALLRSDIVIRRVHVRLDLQEDLPQALGDFVQLQQVVLNLLVNAADATATVFDRERTVTLRTCRAGKELRLLLSDNGVGIAPEVAARMFDPFFTTKPSGLGMGLAISRTIIEAHGGQIWATPNPELGATIGFSLPLPALVD